MNFSTNFKETKNLYFYKSQQFFYHVLFICLYFMVLYFYFQADDSSLINEDQEIGRIRQEYLKKINELDQIEDRNELLRIQTETFVLF